MCVDDLLEIYEVCNLIMPVLNVQTHVQLVMVLVEMLLYIHQPLDHLFDSRRKSVCQSIRSSP